MKQRQDTRVSMHSDTYKLFTPSWHPWSYLSDISTFPPSALSLFKSKFILVISEATILNCGAHFAIAVINYYNWAQVAIDTAAKLLINYYIISPTQTNLTPHLRDCQSVKFSHEFVT